MISRPVGGPGAITAGSCVILGPGRRTSAGGFGLTNRRKLLSPADRSRAEIATGAERAMQGSGFSAPCCGPRRRSLGPPRLHAYSASGWRATSWFMTQ